MNENNEKDYICPICLDAIIGLTNQTITECGHHFHTKCLFKNITSNGFACPYCRKDMTPVNIIEEIEEIKEDNVREPLIPYNFHKAEMENYVLRGLRWLNQQNNNEDLEPEYPDYYPHIEQNDDLPMAPLEDVISKFTKANITNNELIEYILLDYVHDNYVDNLNNNNYKKVYTKLRELDANFKRNQLRNTDYYEDFVNEFQHAINASNNII
jgi:hypothetical protein